MDAKRAVIYARKSTPQEVEEDEKSVTRQVNGGRKWASENGWTIVREYIDEKTSGRLVRKRPRWQALLADAAAGAFEGVIFFDLDRFGRNARAVVDALNRLADLDVTVIDYSTGRPIDLNTFEGRIGTQLTAEFAEQQARTTSKHIRAALHDKARRGLVAGSRCYGYDNLRIAKGHVERRVNEDEALIVRRIYERFAASQPVHQIVCDLNLDKVTSPRWKSQHGRGWMGTTVRSILHRPIYRTGELVYARTRKLWGRDLPKELREQEVAQIGVVEKDWVRASQPDLAIIDPTTAAAVDARLADLREVYAAARKRGRVPQRGRGRYLATGGLLVCPCGSRYEVVDKRFYTCSAHRRKGDGVCTNTLKLPVVETDQRLVDSLLEGVLSPRMIDQMVALVEDGGFDPRPRWEEDRRRLVGERENIVRFIAKGTLTEEQATGELQRIASDLAKVEAQLARPRVARMGRARLRSLLEARTVEWREVLRSEPDVARTLVRRLIGPLVICDRDVYDPWQLDPGGVPDPATTPRKACVIEAEARPTAILDGIVPDSIALMR